MATRAYLAVGLLAAAVFANSLANGFVFDDRFLVGEHPAVRGDLGVVGLLLSSYHGGTALEGTGLYRPLTLVSLAIDHGWAGLDARAFHLVNVLLHVVVSLLVFGLGRRLGLGAVGAFAGAALFAVHPIHTEAVASVAGRAELLAALFFLCALLLHVRAAEPGCRSPSVLAWSAGGLFLLALCAKESAATLVGAVAAWDLLFDRRPGESVLDLARRRWVGLSGGLIPLLAALATYLALRRVALGEAWMGPDEISYIDNPLVEATPVMRTASAAVIAVRYVALLVLPLRLSADYSFAQVLPVESLFSPSVLGAAIVLGGLVALLVGLGRRSAAAAWLAWFLPLTMALTANVLAPIGTVMAERLLYLPSVGACLLLGPGLLWLAGRAGPRAAWAVLAVIVVLASVRTSVRNRDWRDSLALFSSAARISPDSVKVQSNLGVALMRQGRTEQARHAFEAAVARAPDYAAARINFAALLVAEGDLLGAEHELRAAVDADPRDRIARLELSEVLIGLGRYGDAERVLREGLAEAPDSAALSGRLGVLLAARGRTDEAERELRAALAREPESSTLLNELALLRQRMGDVDEAVELLRRAVEHTPSSVPLRNNLGNALRVVGRLDDSTLELESALALDDGFAPSHYNLGLTAERAGRMEAARRSYERAVELTGHGGAQRGLGRLTLRAGDPAGALIHLDAALRFDLADEEATALRGKANLALGRLEAAEADYLRVLELNPRSVAAHNNLGVIRYQAGDRAGARHWWEQALRLAPDSREIRGNLKRLD